MTIKELQAAIRGSLIKMNELIEQQSKTDLKSGDKLVTANKIKKMQERYGKGRKGLFSMRFKNARKSRLETQLSEFTSFNDFISETIVNNAENEKRNIREQYQTFTRNYGNMLTETEYIDMVNIFGALGDKILNQFGSHNIVELYNTTSPENRQNILPAMRDVFKKSRGKGWTAEELLDELYYRLEES